MKKIINRLRNIKRAKAIAKEREIQDVAEWIKLMRQSPPSKFL
jgi:hypothetical protein